MFNTYILSLLLVTSGGGFLMNSSIPTSTVPSLVNLQQVVNLFHVERLKLESYVVKMEQRFNARELSQELKLNKSIEELAAASNELNKEKTETNQLRREMDELTLKVFNLSVDNNLLKSDNVALNNNCTIQQQRSESLKQELNDLKGNNTGLRLELEAKTSALENKITELKNNYTTTTLRSNMRFSTVDIEVNILKRNVSILTQLVDGVDVDALTLDHTSLLDLKTKLSKYK